MRRFTNTLISALAAAAVLLGAFAAAAPAEGRYTISLSAPSSALVGQPVIIQASGTSPPLAEIGTVSWIQAAAIPASVIGACPADDQSALQIATRAAGVLLAIAMRPSADAMGNFSNTLGFAPATPGQWLVCSYQDDGAGLTLASAFASVSVQAATAPASPSPSAGASQPGAGPAPAAKPSNLERPRIVRSGHRLMCKPGKWSNAAGAYAFSWLVNGKPKRGASAATLHVTQGLRGAKVQCNVTASGAGGRAGALSLPARVR